MLQKFGQTKFIFPLAVLFTVNLLLFSLPGLPGSRPVILTAAEDGVNIPDIMGLYSPEEVYHFLDSIGPGGRSAYQIMHFATDLAFPMVYGALLFALLCQQAQKAPEKWHWLPFITLVPVAFDLAENFTMVAITARFPDFLPGLTRLAQVFTIVKFSSLVLCVITIISLGFTKQSSKSDS